MMIIVSLAVEGDYDDAVDGPAECAAADDDDDDCEIAVCEGQARSVLAAPVSDVCTCLKP